MRFVFDENICPAIPVALRDLGEPVTSVHMLNLRGTKDEALAPIIAAEGGFLVTQDRKMLGNAAMVALLVEHQIGAFFLQDAQAPQLEVARVVFRCWPAMRRWAVATGRPFYALLYPHGMEVRATRPGR